MTDPAQTATPSGLVILIAVFNDWAVLGQMLPDLDEALAREQLSATIVVVDDCSTQRPVVAAPPSPFRAVKEIELVSLRRNMGNQRALCIGLVHIFQTRAPEMILVMDADGQDAPEDISKLLAKYREGQGQAVVFAARSKRAEGLVFRTGYWLFTLFHYILTGIKVRVGNFSVVPYAALGQMVATPELWSHYAAAVFRSKCPRATVDIPRAKRVAGDSKTNYVFLITHGLTAVSVFSEIVGVRMLMAAGLLILLSVLAMGTVVALRLTTAWVLPGWASLASGLILLIMLQSVGMCCLFVFVILYTRSHSSFLPLRDCPIFVAGRKRVYPA